MADSMMLDALRECGGYDLHNVFLRQGGWSDREEADRWLENAHDIYFGCLGSPGDAKMFAPFACILDPYKVKYTEQRKFVIPHVQKEFLKSGDVEREQYVNKPEIEVTDHNTFETLGDQTTLREQELRTLEPGHFWVRSGSEVYKTKAKLIPSPYSSETHRSLRRAEMMVKCMAKNFRAKTD